MRAGPSGLNGDRGYLQWLRDRFRDDVYGMVEDKMAIYRYGVDVEEDQPPVQRCK